MIKKTLLILWSFLLLICLGCSALQKNDLILKVNLKTDHNSNFGMAAATDDGKIYYISNEAKEEAVSNGIYRMDEDGEKVRLEVTNPNILSLQIKDGEINYSGLYSADQNNRSTVYTSGYLHRASSITSDDYLSGDNRNTILDYTTDSGEVVCVSTANARSYTSRHYNDTLKEIIPVAFMYPSIVYADDYDSIGEKTEYCEYNFEIGIYDTFLVGGYKIEENNNGYPYGCRATCFIVDTVTKEVIFQKRKADEYSLRFVGMQNGILHMAFTEGFWQGRISNKELLISVNLETKEVSAKEVDNLLGNNCITDSIEIHDNLYVITQNIRDYEKDKIYPEDQKLQILNPKTATLTPVFECGENEQIIDIRNDMIVTLKETILTKYSFTKGKITNSVTIGELSRLQSTTDEIEMYLADTAGDWIFFYRVFGGFDMSYNADMGKQLLYKINIKTGEIYENKADFDFSELDPYRIEK